MTYPSPSCIFLTLLCLLWSGFLNAKPLQVGSLRDERKERPDAYPLSSTDGFLYAPAWREINLERNSYQPTSTKEFFETHNQNSNWIEAWTLGTVFVRQTSQGAVHANNRLISTDKFGTINQSSLGIIANSDTTAFNVTQLSPNSTLVGIDLLNASTCCGRKPLSTQIWLQKSKTEGATRDSLAYGGGIAMPAIDGIRGELHYKEVQENFNSTLGAVNTLGIQEFEFDLGYNLLLNNSELTPWLKSVYWGVKQERFHKIGLGFQSSKTTWTMADLNLYSSTRFRIQIECHEKNVKNSFFIHQKGNDQWFIKADNYTFDALKLAVNLTPSDSFRVATEYQTGDYYNGQRDQIEVVLDWQPVPKVATSMLYKWNKIQLPAGDYHTQKSSLMVTYHLSSNLIWRNFSQYDNLIGTFGINSRIAWHRPQGSELFLEINQNLKRTDKDDEYSNATTGVAVRAGYTIWF